MLDFDIRQALWSHVREVHQGERNTIAVEELGILQGLVRVDLAVVNGSLYAYEIKSDRDNLDRLPRQAEMYSRVFDYATLVASEDHIEKSEHLIPPWWGIIAAIPVAKDRVELRPFRPSGSNRSVDARSVVELLWRDEALDLLKQVGADRGFRTKSRDVIWDRVCEVCSIDEIKQAVRRCLKQRRVGSFARSRVLDGE